MKRRPKIKDEKKKNREKESLRNMTPEEKTPNT